MGDDVIDKLVKDRRLLRQELDENAIKKEIEVAEYDLKTFEKSLKEGVNEWATIQSYYSMFHSARALLFSAGFREKSHIALIAAIKELFSDKLGGNMINSLEDGKILREEANYSMSFSKEGAEENVRNAKSFLIKSKRILGL